MVKVYKLLDAWVPGSNEKRTFELVVTDVFGTPLLRDQEILYAKEHCGRTQIFSGKILGMSTDGSLFLEWGDDKKTSTISKASTVLNDNGTGQLRYEQIYVPMPKVADMDRFAKAILGQ